MYIEDVITKVGTQWFYSGNNTDFETFLRTKDFEIISNMSDQLASGDALTEKQANLALRILNKNSLAISDIVPDIFNTLVSPSWKYKFRVLPTLREISIKEVEETSPTPHKRTAITLSFPYDHSLVEEFKNRNYKTHDIHRGSWNSRIKLWVFPLTEKNILYLGDKLLEMGFQASEDFLNYYNELVTARAEFEKHIPMLTYNHDKFEIVNGHPSIPQPDTESVAEALFFARKYGVTVWDETVDKMLTNHGNDVTRKILNSTKNDRVWVNHDEIQIDNFNDLVYYGGNILIVVPGGSEYALTKKWVEYLNRIGISNKEISVMFRLPNEQANFNTYVREQQLNNPVDENTRIVFVSTKITKPLVKSGIQFKTAINLGYYNYMHFTMSALMDSMSNLVFYSMKAPTERTSWQQHEL